MSYYRLTLATLAVTGLCACSSPVTRAIPTEKATGELVLGTPTLHLRAVFDKDPSPYIGRFPSDATAPGDLSESGAAQTACSKYVKWTVAEAAGHFEKILFASESVQGEIGFEPIASVGASHTARAKVLVTYDQTMSMRSNIEDFDGFEACCAEGPGRCTGSYVSEFVRGNGMVYQFLGKEDEVKADGSWKAFSAEVKFKRGAAWRQVTSFQDAYFAFRTTARRGGGGGCPDSAGWPARIPNSEYGLFFQGISKPKSTEQAARDGAMEHARRQVVRYAIGVRLSEAGVHVSSEMEGVLDDIATRTSESSGVASRVLPCGLKEPPTHEATPRGMKTVREALAFIKRSDIDKVAALALEETANLLHKKGHIDGHAKAKLLERAKLP